MTFLSPWILGAFLVVPVLWWLLRVMPPKPRTVKFPAFFLLKDLQANIKTAAHTPWWLLFLRSLIVILFILAMAGPVRNIAGGLPGNGTILMVIDNGWGAAANWKERQDKAKDILAQARRSGRSVILMPTASEQGHSPMSADEAIQNIDTLTPQPWPEDHVKIAAAAREVIEKNPVSWSVFLSGGLEQYGTQDFLNLLQEKAGGVQVVHDDNVNDPYIMKISTDRPGAFAFHIERLTYAQTRHLSLMAYGADGGVIDAHKFDIPANENKTDVAWDMPAELRGKIARVALDAPAMASAAFYTDSRWRQHPAGIVADPGRKDSRSFLNEVYYLKRALEGGGTLAVDAPDVLMKLKLSAIIWPDSAAVTATDREALAEWVKAGGFLVRFAGPNLAANPDDALLPVKLRYGQRSMEGAMTWEKPIRLGGIPEQSPLAGIEVPKDVTVTRQILAEPSPESFEKTWLQLEDGTPLVTGGSFGKGAVVLVHTTAGPDWSDFCYSGLYVEALQRMVSLSAGIADYKAQAVLPPLLLADGFGRLRTPDEKGAAGPVDPSKDFTPSPQTPPGLYGDERQFRVFNLGEYLPQMKKLVTLPAGAGESGYALSGEESLKAEFFKWAILLLLVETLATLWMRGVFVWPVWRRGGANV